jgi:hypothetical protein
MYVFGSMGQILNKEEYRYSKKNDDFYNDNYDKDVLINDKKLSTDTIINAEKQNYKNFILIIAKIIEKNNDSDLIVENITEYFGGFLFFHYHSYLILLECAKTFLITKNFPLQYKNQKNKINSEVYLKLYELYSVNSFALNKIKFE